MAACENATSLAFAEIIMMRSASFLGVPFLYHAN
jgi:hypothetical protein